MRIDGPVLLAIFLAVVAASFFDQWWSERQRTGASATTPTTKDPGQASSLDEYFHLKYPNSYR